MTAARPMIARCSTPLLDRALALSGSRSHDTRHITVDRQQPLAEAVAAEVQSAALALELILFGAVFVKPFASQPTAKPRRVASVAAGGSVVLVPGDYVRVHSFPRRFLGANLPSSEWARRIVPSVLADEHDDFVVVDKPAGVPTHGTLDNSHENAQRRVCLGGEIAVP